VLIITRRAGERIMVGDDIVVEVMEMVGNSVRIGISAPRSVPVYREEIYTAVRDEKHRRRMISRYNHEITKEQWALGFEWDIVLRGQESTPFENRQ
jgi:carbon storage regulator